MNPTTAAKSPQAQAASSAPGLTQQARLLWRDLHGLAHDHLQLAALETQRAGESLVTMIIAGMLVAGLLLSVWLGLVGVAVFVLTGHGMIDSSSALLLAVAINLLAALILCRVIRHHSYHLQFPANTGSLRSLAPESPNAEAE